MIPQKVTYYGFPMDKRLRILPREHTSLTNTYWELVYTRKGAAYGNLVLDILFTLVAKLEAKRGNLSFQFI